MTKIKQLLLILIVSVLLVLLGGCNDQDNPDETSIPTPTASATQYSYIVSIDENPSIKVSGSEFEVTTNNCGSRVSALESFSRSREFEVTLNAEFSESLRGKLGGDLIIAGAELETEVGLQLGVQVGSTESVRTERQLETPSDSITIVKLRWEEIWQTGRVTLITSNRTEIGEVPIRVLTTLRLTQTGVQDIPCGTLIANSSPDNPSPTSSSDTAEPEVTPLITPRPADPTKTNTPRPTITPQPTSTPSIPTNTPPPSPLSVASNTGLELGEYYTQGNVSFAVTNLEFGKSNDGLSIRPFFHIRNISGNTISFDYGYYNFQVKDNLGNIFPASGYISSWTMVLEPGEFIQLDAGNFYWRFNGNYSDPNVMYLTITVTNLSSIESAEWIIPVNH